MAVLLSSVVLGLAGCRSEIIKKLVPISQEDRMAAAAEEAANAMAPAEKDPDHVRVLFAGDTHFIWGVSDLQREKGVHYPVARLQKLFHSADFRILNLETAISSKGAPISKKAFIFNADPSASIELLRGLKLDLALLGNNHSMDMGAAGLDDTVARLRAAGIGAVGAGRTAREAASPYYFTVDGVKFAVLSFSNIGTPEVYSTFARPGVASMRNNLFFLVKKYAKTADHLLISLHWGIEYYTKPTPEQVKTARALIDAGASVIIGHHPHIPQGMEVYRGGLICYSLGNFLFGSVNPYQTQNLVLRLDVRKQDRKLRMATLYPVQGRYRDTGHAIRMVPPAESRGFWQEFYLQSSDLNAGFKRRFRISQSGTGELLIGEG